jgi:hypothetical protein
MTRQALQLKGVNPKTPFALNMLSQMIVSHGTYDEWHRYLSTY